MRFQRKRTASEVAHVVPASMNAADPIRIKKKSALSAPGSADFTSILETKSFKALKVRIKRYLEIYIRPFQNISTLAFLEGPSLSVSTSQMVVHPPYSTRV